MAKNAHPEQLGERFASHVSPEPNSGCWLWTGSCDRKGYGQIRVAPRVLKYATHVSLALVGREVPKGMAACHRCDNPNCVNPDHLFIGTQRDNIQDAKAKGRMNLDGLEAGRVSRADPLKKHHAKRLYDSGVVGIELARLVGVSATVAQKWMIEWGHKAVDQKTKTHCRQGHPYSGGNLYISPRGDRQCRICMRATKKRSEAKHAKA